MALEAIQADGFLARRAKDWLGLVDAPLGDINAADRALNLSEDFGLIRQFRLGALRGLIEHLGNLGVAILCRVWRTEFRAGIRQHIEQKGFDALGFRLFHTRAVALLAGDVRLPKG